jgi:hypothetical protein
MPASDASSVIASAVYFNWAARSNSSCATDAPRWKLKADRQCSSA